MNELLNYIGISGFLCIILSTFIEISPIRIYPIQWFGNLLFAGIRKDIKTVNDKLDTHIVQGYRRDILNFQNECLRDVKHTKEQFNNVLKSVDEYEDYIESNGLKNGEVEEAMKYIKRVHQRCLDNHDFLDISNLT